MPRTTAAILRHVASQTSPTLSQKLAQRPILASPERQEAALLYYPRHHRELWETYKDVLVHIVLLIPDSNPRRDIDILSTLNAFWAWAAMHRYRLDPDSLLTGNRMQAFAEAKGNSYRQTIRYRLRSAFDAWHGKDQEPRYGRAAPRPPHTDAQRDRYIEAAQNMVARTSADHETARNTQFLVNASFGAGVSRSSIHKVTSSWFHNGHRGPVLRDPVRGIDIPIPLDYAARLAPLIDPQSHQEVLRPGYPQRDMQSSKVLRRALILAPDLHGFDVARAARRWQVDLLNAANLDVVAALCGYKRGQKTLTDLIPFLTVHTEDERSKLSEGWLR